MVQSPPLESYLTICLNPTIQKTLVYESLAPGEVNRCSLHRVDIAGKGVCPARVLGQLGKKALHLTHLGGATRPWFLELCRDDGVEVSWVESNSEIRFCTTVIERSRRSATELVEESRPVGAGTAEALVERFRELLPGVGSLLLAGTAASGYPADIMPRLARIASEAGRLVFLDLKGAALLGCLPFRPVAVKPNLEELLQTYPLAGGQGADEGAIRDHVASIGRDFHGRHGSYLVVTRGARPTLFWDGQRLLEAPVEALEAVNPIGSGDSFHVGLATALSGGATIAEAVAEGTRLGALNARRLKPGTILGPTGWE